MGSFSTKIVLRQVVLWCVLIVAVSLLTLLFTVLGTITCAVLTGMMMGASDHRRWQTVPVSFVFPGVVVLMVHAAKVELAGSQRIWLPTLCFAAFWLTYLLTCALMRFESRASAKSTGDSESEPSPGLKPTQTVEAASPSHELNLAELQGRWSCESVGSDGNLRIKIIEVEGENLSLSILGADGKERLVAAGAVHLKSSTGSKPRVFVEN